MTTTIHLASVGAGKTETALQFLIDTLHDSEKPFPRVWVLLATKRQEVGFRQRLVDLAEEHRVHFNVEFFNFYELNTRLLNIQGKPLKRIQQSSRMGILRMILAQMLTNDELHTFSKIADKAGFVQVIADFIDELKQYKIYPETYQSVAETEKDRELARIYARYQGTLQDRDLMDLEGEGWLALEAVKAGIGWAQPVDLLLVDGYDQFTPVQAELLARLSQQIPLIDITLTTMAGEAESRITTRFGRALKRLNDIHQQVGISLETKLIQPITEDRPPELLLLGERIFQPKAEPIVQPNYIHFIEAGDPAQEVAMVLRQVKERLLNGTRPDEILVALRDWQRYASHFQTFQETFQLPLFMHYMQSLNRNPMIEVVMRLFSLAPNFRRREVLDILRSPYIQATGLDDEAVDLLDTLTIQGRFTGGDAHAWQEEIQRATKGGWNDEEERPALLTVAQADELSLSLEDFLNGITPHQHETITDRVLWIEDLIGHDVIQNPEEDPDDWQLGDLNRYSLHITQSIQHPDVPDAIRRRDINALNNLKQILQGFVRLQSFLSEQLEYASPDDWDSFYRDLKLAVDSHTETPPNVGRTNQVLVTTATNARGLPHPHVFILGLSESIFPAEVPEDPLYLDTERESLASKGMNIEKLSERVDDTGLFYELISLARQSLTLSRPTVREGKLWIESHLWRAVRSLCPTATLTELKAGQLPPLERVASQEEMLIAVADGLNQEDAGEAEAVLSTRNWILTDSEVQSAWKQVSQGRTIELKRSDETQRFNEYSGRLKHPDLIANVAKQLDTTHKWSASQLNEYGACGFRFFASRLLRLESLDEPKEGMDVLQSGSLYHHILEKTYRELSEIPDFAFTNEFRDEALDILHEMADEEFRNAPAEYGFRETVTWNSEQDVIRRRLQRLLENDFSPNYPFTTYGEGKRTIRYIEVSFGMGSTQAQLQLPNDEMIQLRGKIDRVDQVGDKLIIVDYKTGTAKIDTSELTAGRNFQMLVYIEALRDFTQQRNVSATVAGGFFWHIRNLSTSGMINLSDDKSVAVLDTAKQHLAQHIHSARIGDFSVAPSKLENGRCAKHCPYFQLCRIRVTNNQRGAS